MLGLGIGCDASKRDDPVGFEGVRPGPVDEHPSTVAHTIPLPQLLLTP